ncbi:MAG: alpha/beta hydrolase [Acidipropionibacterium sp.]|jgi:alpha-beta hydrolase superfamily lysophospholipase|nr:alpha/beta hydrolase [Acidipropionibacterium sp.]
MDCITLTADDGAEVDVLVWEPESEPRGIVQIDAGMCEYAARYDEFARGLADDGWLVISGENRGEGPRALARGELGQLPDRGYHQLLDDMSMVIDHFRAERPDLPWILIGHSMGSFLARMMAARRGREMAALVLIGTGGSLGPAGPVGLGIAEAQIALAGEDRRSRLMNTLAFGSFNAAFRPARTDFDWLSRDREMVDAYVADPLCGYVCSAGFYRELLKLMRAANSVDVMGAVPPQLPVGLFSGAADPVGGAGRGVRGVAANLRAAGVRHVDVVLYPQGRHEILNEINRAQVHREIRQWIDETARETARMSRL